MPKTVPFDMCPLGPFFGLDGKPVAGGLLWFLNSATNLPETVYVDRAGTVASENPAPLGGDGCLLQQLWLRKGVSYDIWLMAPNSASSHYDPDDFPGSDWVRLCMWTQESDPDAAIKPVATVDTIADLVALDPVTVDGQAVEVLGYYAKGDSKARTYLWTAGAASSADGGAVVGAPAYSGSDAWKLVTGGADEISSAIWGDVYGAPANSFPTIAATAAAWCANNGKRLVLEPGVRMVSASTTVSFSCPTIVEKGFHVAPTSNTDIILRFEADNTEIRPTSSLHYGGQGSVTVQTGGTFHGTISSGVVDWTEPSAFSPNTTVRLSSDVTAHVPHTIPTLEANGHTITGGGAGLTIGRIIRAEGTSAAVDSTGAKIYVQSDFRASDLTAAAFAELSLSDQSLKLAMDVDRALSDRDYSWRGVTLEPFGGKLGGFTRLLVREVTCAQVVFADGAENVYTNTPNNLDARNFETQNAGTFASLVGNCADGVVDLGGMTFVGLAGSMIFPRVVENGAMEFAEPVGVLAGDVDFKRVALTFSDSPTPTGAGFSLGGQAVIRFIGCTISGKTANVTISVGAGGCVEFDSCSVDVRVVTITPDVASPSTFTAKNSSFLNERFICIGDGAVTIDHCITSCRIILKGDLTTVSITNNFYTGAGDALSAITNGNYPITRIGHIRIAGNLPENPYTSEEGVARWPQTEGRIVFDDLDFGSGSGPWTATKTSKVGVLSFPTSIIPSYKKNIVWSADFSRNDYLLDDAFARDANFNGIRVSAKLVGTSTPSSSSFVITVFFNCSN